MNLYSKDDITISVIEESDKESVLKLFQENDFNCDYETGSLRPSDGQFLKLMDDIIAGRDNINSIFVLKKNGEVIGYEGMFVEFDRLIIGHIAVDNKEREKGYGELLTTIALLVAENEDRDVSLYCLYPNSYLCSLGFKTSDNVHYLYNRKGIKKDDVKKVFMSVDEYREKQEREMKEELDSYSEFLKSDIMKKVLDY